MATKKITTRDMVLTGLLSAFCFVATYFIRIPYGGAMIHMGTTAIFISSLVFGGVKGGLAGGIGLGLFDLMGGYVSYVPWTIVTKGLTGYLCGQLSRLNKDKTNAKKQLIFDIIGCITGGLVSLVGYFFADLIYIGYAKAFAHTVASLSTTGIAILIALPLSSMIRYSMKTTR